MNVLLLPAIFAMMPSVTSPPKPLYPIPSARQLAWHKTEFYAFVHFGPNTFTNREWGLGDEPASVFNPTKLDCGQWVKLFKKAGMKGVVITAKHHDGFCLWPSKYTVHTVAKSPWENGKGDVLKDLSKACHRYGMKFGVYVSPWDRNNPEYGTPSYNQLYANMLKEVLTHYGPVFEMWFDGANGEGPKGKKQVYDWSLFHKIVREYQPNACMFSDAGPDERWVGNEQGIAIETNWCTFTEKGMYPGMPETPLSGTGIEGGDKWIPAECDVSIRPGWFYHADENPKSVAQLMSIWYTSIGRGANLILNVPADKEGLISKEDAQRLLEFAAARKAEFSHPLTIKSATASDYRGDGFEPEKATDGNDSDYWATHDGVTTASLTVDFGRIKTFDIAEIHEYIELGQRVADFSIEAKTANGWKTIATETTIGPHRLLKFEPVSARYVRLNIINARACPTISLLKFYKSPNSQ